MVEILERRGLQKRELVDAAELARRLGIERSWVYTHAIDLGTVKLGRPPPAVLQGPSTDGDNSPGGYKAAKVREREQGLIERPLSNRTINKTLTRLGQILDAAVRYDLIDYNPVKTKVEKLKEAEPKRTRLMGEQVHALLRAAGPHRTLLATDHGRGLRISELTNLRWRDLNLRDGLLNVAASKTPVGVCQVVLETELVQLLRNTRTRPSGPSRRTSCSQAASARSHASATPSAPAITAAQMGHRDPRMTLRVYTDVTGVKPKTRLGWLLRKEPGEGPRSTPLTGAGAHPRIPVERGT